MLIFLNSGLCSCNSSICRRIILLFALRFAILLYGIHSKCLHNSSCGILDVCRFHELHGALQLRVGPIMDVWGLSPSQVPHVHPVVCLLTMSCDQKKHIILFHIDRKCRVLTSNNHCLSGTILFTTHSSCHSMATSMAPWTCQQRSCPRIRSKEKKRRPMSSTWLISQHCSPSTTCALAFAPRLYLWLAWPLSYAVLLLTCISGSAFTLERHRLKELQIQTWIVPRFSFQV